MSAATQVKTAHTYVPTCEAGEAIESETIGPPLMFAMVELVIFPWTCQVCGSRRE
jgi:hypothetical protein